MDHLSESNDDVSFGASVTPTSSATPILAEVRHVFGALDGEAKQVDRHVFYVVRVGMY